MKSSLLLIVLVSISWAEAYDYEKDCAAAKQNIIRQSGCELDVAKAASGKDRFFICRDGGIFVKAAHVKYMSRKSEAGYEYNYCEVVSVDGRRMKVTWYTDKGTKFEGEYQIYNGDVIMNTPINAKWTNLKDNSEMTFKYIAHGPKSESNFYSGDLPCSKSSYHLFVQGHASDCKSSNKQPSENRPKINQ